LLSRSRVLATGLVFLLLVEWHTAKDAGFVQLLVQRYSTTVTVDLHNERLQ
jgi:hypothetical protein